MLMISTVFPIIVYAKSNGKGPKNNKGPKENKGPPEGKGYNKNEDPDENSPPIPQNEPNGKANGKVNQLSHAPFDEPETIEEMALNNPYANPYMPPLTPPNKGKAKHLYLFEKNPDTWDIVVGGAWGKLKYFMNGKFVFNGHGLGKGATYCLIYYPDPWPGNGLRCLGTATANGGGNVHIMGEFNFNDIPIEEDENLGAKIWLVLSDDVYVDLDMPSNNHMDGWNPTQYLFEYNLINVAP